MEKWTKNHNWAQIHGTQIAYMPLPEISESESCFPDKQNYFNEVKYETSTIRKFAGRS